MERKNKKDSEKKERGRRRIKRKDDEIIRCNRITKENVLGIKLNESRGMKYIVE